MWIHLKAFFGLCEPIWLIERETGKLHLTERKKDAKGCAYAYLKPDHKVGFTWLHTDGTCTPTYQRLSGGVTARWHPYRKLNDQSRYFIITGAVVLLCWLIPALCLLGATVLLATWIQQQVISPWKERTEKRRQLYLLDIAISRQPLDTMPVKKATAVRKIREDLHLA